MADRRGVYRDFIGKEYGCLKVVSFFKRYKDRRSAWLCECSDCKQVRPFFGSTILKKPERCMCLNKIVCTESRAYYYCKKDALRRGKEFELSESEFLSVASLSCAYCGLSPKEKRFSTSSPCEVVNGLDRVDNNLGYSVNNVVACCRDCNRAKGTLPFSEWMSWVDQITAFRAGTRQLSEYPERYFQVAQDNKTVSAVEAASEEMRAAMELDPDEKAEFELWDNTLMDGLEDEGDFLDEIITERTERNPEFPKLMEDAERGRAAE